MSAPAQSPCPDPGAAPRAPADAALPRSPHYALDVSPDGLRAELRLTATGLRKLPLDTLLAELAKSPLRLLPDLRARLEPLFKEPPKGTPPPVVIAEGTPPRPDQPRRLVPAAPQADASAPIFPPPVAQAGETIASVEPARPGADGEDVFARPLRRPAAADNALAALCLGQGVRLSPDGLTVIATVAGIPHVTDASASVAPATRVAAVHAITGPIEIETGDVVIENAVGGRAKVNAVSGSVYVGEAVEGADVHAGGDIAIRGGAMLHEHGRLVAARDVAARFIARGTVHAGRHITCANELDHCTIVCGGTLTVTDGPMMGGHAIANGGAVLHSLGAASFPRTLLEVGFHEPTRTLAVAHLEGLLTRRKKAQRTRDVVEPLLRHQRHLTPAQKERATELLYAAQSVTNAIDAMLARIRGVDDLVRPFRKAEARVLHRLFPGVTIRFPGVETTIRMEVSGPLRVVARVEHNRRHVVLIDETTGKERPLEFRPIEDDPVLLIDDLMHPRPEPRPTQVA